jgi:hypothetical protein
MENMIYGDYPDFNELISGITLLEQEINNLSAS